MKYITKTIFNYTLLLALLISGATTLTAKAQNIDTNFNPNYILSDESFAFKNVFPNERSIQEYLEKVNSPLKAYNVESAKASHWIYTAANGTTSSAYNVRPNLNPGMLLAYLEKEQSLLSLTNYNVNTDPEKRIQTAMGFGCPDNSSCDPKYKGFINQINYAAYQLQYNYNLSVKDQSQTYRVGNTIKTLDDKDVKIDNHATAATYRYTPHVFFSSYNLWKIMTDNNWGATGTVYQGSFVDNSPNIGLNDSYKVNFEDDLKTIEPTKLNYSIKVSDPVSADQSKNTCNELYNKNWTFGEENSEVEKLQECLRQKNLFDHVITGYFGPITKTGLEKVRKEIANSTTQIPVVVNNQNNYGSNVIVITSASNNAQDNCSDLKKQTWVYGTNSDEVERLQRCMQKIGVFNHIYGATGYFGPVTQKALNTWRGMA
jgi:hypothetical protein